MRQVPPELKDIADEIRFFKNETFKANLSEVIEVDFDISKSGNEYVFSPELTALSPSTFNWKSGEESLSDAPVLRLPADEVPQEITLIVNGIESEAVTKKIPGANTPEKTTANNKEPKNGSVSDGEINYELGRKLSQNETYSDLQQTLRELTDSGRAAFGRKNDFNNPADCWVLLVNPETQKVDHVLTPDDGNREDLKSGKNYMNFEENLKGLVAIWLELF